MRIDAFVSVIVICLMLFSPVLAQTVPQGKVVSDGSEDYEIPDSYVDSARQSGPYVELTLQEAIRMALKNNLQIELEGYTQEINKELIYGTKGFYDPIFNFSVGWNSSERPTTSVLDAGQSVATTISKQWNYNSSLSQNVRGGGNVALQFNTNSRSTNSSFSYINPSYGSNMDLSFTQPLWRGFRHTAPDRQVKLYNPYKQHLHPVSHYNWY